MKKVATIRLKIHAYDEILINDVLKCFKKIEENKKKPSKWQRRSKKNNKEVENNQKDGAISRKWQWRKWSNDESDNLKDLIQEMNVGKVEEIAYSILVFVDFVARIRNKTHFAYVYQVDEVLDQEFAVTGMKSVERNKIESALVEKY